MYQLINLILNSYVCSMLANYLDNKYAKLIHFPCSIAYTVYLILAV